MGQTDSVLKICNNTTQNVHLSFRSMDEFDFCGNLDPIKVLNGKILFPGQGRAVPLKIKSTANGVMFTLDLKIGDDKVSLRMDQKIALKEKNYTSIDFKVHYVDSMSEMGRMYGNSVYSCTGDVKKYDLRCTVQGDNTAVITIAHNKDYPIHTPHAPPPQINPQHQNTMLVPPVRYPSMNTPAHAASVLDTMSSLTLSPPPAANKPALGTSHKFNPPYPVNPINPLYEHLYPKVYPSHNTVPSYNTQSGFDPSMIPQNVPPPSFTMTYIPPPQTSAVQKPWIPQSSQTSNNFPAQKFGSTPNALPPLPPRPSRPPPPIPPSEFPNRGSMKGKKPFNGGKSPTHLNQKEISNTQKELPRQINKQDKKPFNGGKGKGSNPTEIIRNSAEFPKRPYKKGKKPFNRQKSSGSFEQVEVTDDDLITFAEQNKNPFKHNTSSECLDQIELSDDDAITLSKQGNTSAAKKLANKRADDRYEQIEVLDD